MVDGLLAIVLAVTMFANAEVFTVNAVPLTCGDPRPVPDLSFTDGSPGITWDRYLPPNLDNSGKPADAIRLVSSTFNQTGSLWNKTPFTLTDFLVEAVVQLDIAGDGVSFNFGNGASLTKRAVRANTEYEGVEWTKYSGIKVYATPRWNATEAAFVLAGTETKQFCKLDLCYKPGALNAFLRQKLTYKVRVEEATSGQTLSVNACLRYDNGSEDCLSPLTNVTLPKPLTTYPAAGDQLYFGIGGVNAQDSKGIVDLFSVTFYACTKYPTTTTTQPTTTTKTTTAPTTTVTVSNTETSTTVGTPSTRARSTTAGSSTVSSTGTSKTTRPSTKPSTLLATPGTTPPVTTVPPEPVGSSAIMNRIKWIAATPFQQIQKLWYPFVEDVRVPQTSMGQLLDECQDFAPNRAAPPPSLGNSNVAKIKATFGIDSFVGIDTVSETITVAGVMLLSWPVTTCPMASSDIFTSRRPEGLLVSSSNEVWTPAYYFISDTSNIFMQKTEPDQFGEDLIAITSHTDGSPNRTIDFYWIKGGAFVSSCDLDLTKFPFDKQSCVFSFSLMRSTSLLTFSEQPEFLLPDPIDEFEDDEWKYESRGMELSTAYYRGQPTSAVHFCIAMKRKPDYYIANLVLPTAVLVLVEVGTFVLPPSFPDRPAISVTILLAITVAQSTVTGQVPKKESILLVNYITGLSWLSTISTLYQMVTCWYTIHTFGEANDKEAPRHRCRGIRIVRIVDFIAMTLTLGALVAANVYLFVMGA